MKQLLVRKGEVIVEEVPAPSVGRRSILVRVRHSCVSVGTEVSGVRMSNLPLYRRALKQPHHVKKVVQLMRDQGVKRVWDRITGMLAAGTPTGYSAAGEVVAVGSDVLEFAVGDRVACAGAGIANHAEFIDVPVNLAVRIPEGVSTAEASTVTLGAIALQGVRRANPTLGESFLVIGLGLLGQLSAQMLLANGCVVIGSDVDPKRLTLAKSRGVHHVLDASEEDVAERVLRLTGGAGADGVIVTAGASGDSVLMSQAMNASRRKGRVVIVGDVGLNLQRHEFYAKELDLLISCSYGPGRYDPNYEQDGEDYPLGYVRWTENRNMEAFLRLLAEGRIDISCLEPRTWPLESAPEAYSALTNPPPGSGEKPLVVLIEYPRSEQAPQRRIVLRSAAPARRVDGRIRTAVVGAGGFAQGMHLPNLVKRGDRFEVRTIVSRTGSNALAAARLFGAREATTDLAATLADAEIDLVVICTRHDLHVPMTLAALDAGKHVLVEKPLALDEAGLSKIEAWYAEAARTGRPLPLLLTGFNRRFAPAVRRIGELLADRSTPMIVNYRMNAGHIPLDHWVHGVEGGGRNIGEACHLYDLFAALTGARPVDVKARAIDLRRASRGGQWNPRDNFVATIGYDDGSVCTLTYTALGSKSYPKERMEIFCDGLVVSLDDYKRLEVAGSSKRGWKGMSQNKGQLAELDALAVALAGGEWPIALQSMLDTTRVSFEVERHLEESARSATSSHG